MLHQSSAFKRIRWLGCGLSAFLGMKVDMLVATAAPCQRRAAAPAPAAMATGIYLHRGRSAEAPSRTDAGPEEAKASPTSAPLEPRRGSDGDGDGTPAFISSSASQELFECAVSATCERFSPVPVHLQLDAVSPCCCFTAAFTSGCCKLLPASLCGLYRSGDDITGIKRIAAYSVLVSELLSCLSAVR